MRVCEEKAAERPVHRREAHHAAATHLVPLAVALVMTLFAWPSARLEPRDLPVGVADQAGARAASSSSSPTSSIREEIPSLANTLRRWYSTVFGLTNSCDATSLLV
jgi:hypothetical protein